MTYQRAIHELHNNVHTCLGDAPDVVAYDMAETDYWNASDTPDMSDEQIAYRQSLRDITETYTSLEDVVWPTKP